MSSVVGIVGADYTQAVRRAGGEPLVGEAGEVVDAAPAAVVAAGEPALCSLVAAGVDAPVLPVDVGPGIPSVAATDVDAALEALVAGEYTHTERPILAADDGTRALFDCMLVTTEPARISEYTVHCGNDRVATFRADGVVVATPAGSHGYARRADGPVVAPETGVVAVVPFAPFSTDADNWVVAPERLRLTVERDEAPVDLLADDRIIGEVTARDPIEFGTTERLGVAVVPESAGPFA
jgi:NAD+ kinase